MKSSVHLKCKLLDDSDVCLIRGWSKDGRQSNFSRRLFVVGLRSVHCIVQALYYYAKGFLESEDQSPAQVSHLSHQLNIFTCWLWSDKSAILKYSRHFNFENGTFCSWKEILSPHHQLLISSNNWVGCTCPLGISSLISQELTKVVLRFIKSFDCIKIFSRSIFF